MATNKIWDKILIPGEEIKFEFSLGKRYLNLVRNGCIFLGVPLLLLFGLGIFLILFGIFWSWYLRRANNYAFTNKRLLVLKGWLSTHLISIDYDKITDVRVQQPFGERVIFNTGTLIINTAGTAAPEVILTNIEDPYQVKQKLHSIAREAGKTV